MFSQFTDEGPVAEKEEGSRPGPASQQEVELVSRSKSVGLPRRVIATGLDRTVRKQASKRSGATRG